MVKPYSAFAAETFNPSTYPSCKLFLRCRETSGTTFRDEVTGADITVGSSISQVGNAARVVARSPLPVLSDALGATIAAGSHATMVFIVHTPHTAGDGITLVGTDTNNHIHLLAPSTCAADIYDDLESNLVEHTFTNDALTLDTSFGAALVFAPGATSTAYYYQTTGSTWDTDSVTTAVAGAAYPVDHITNSPEFSAIRLGLVAGEYSDYFMAAVFTFAGGVPADIKPALLWMTSMALAGTPAVYPGWAA